MTEPRRRRHGEVVDAMRRTRTACLLVPTLVVACASPDRHTLADLRNVEPDMTEVQIEKGLDQAMIGYQNFLEQAPESSLTCNLTHTLACKPKNTLYT